MIKNGEMDTVKFEATHAARKKRVHHRRNVQIKRIDEISLQPAPCQAFLQLLRLPCLSLSHH